MTDRPIIFSAPMIRALLEGRKSQTRRVLKLAGRAPDYIGPHGCQDDPTCWGWEMPDIGGYVTVGGDDKDHLPGWRNGWRDWQGAYAPGDRLWVREAFSYDRLDVERDGILPPWHWADGNPESGDWSRPKPSIHMPRWASRLTLIVTDVRVQRLGDLTDEDAIAEGIDVTCGLTPSVTYAILWDKINAKRGYPWKSNPWIVALTFRTELSSAPFNQ